MACYNGMVSWSMAVKPDVTVPVNSFGSHPRLSPVVSVYHKHLCIINNAQDPIGGCLPRNGDSDLCGSGYDPTATRYFNPVRLDVCSHGLYSYGLHSYGLHCYGLRYFNRSDWTYVVMAYVVMAYIVMAYTVMA